MDHTSRPNDNKYQAWFQHVDADKDGRVTGTDAKGLFPRARLPQKQLAQVWALSDQARRGYLDYDAFCKAMELITLAQSGLEVSEREWEKQRTKAGAAGIAAPQMQGLDELVGDCATAADNPFGAPEPAVDDSSKKRGKKLPKGTVTSVVDGLKQIYFGKLRTLEETYNFQQFYSPLLNVADFEAKPSVLLLGQYSTGKTTFIKYLLGRDYPGANIGPEPTTDRFTVVMHGYEDRRIPGNTLAVSPDQPYQSLHHFGTGFLGRLEGAQCPTDLLEHVTLVDTPGVLSGEKQRIERSYSFIQVCQWFASRADLILLLFDPYKLDISDEFKETITAMRGHEEKVRVVLNKSDTVAPQQLLRVYGALMWSLGKVFKNPEVCRVYVGSFNGDKSVRDDINPSGKELFEAEQADLMVDLFEIPKRSCDRKINELVKRVRALKVHLLILQHLKRKMPSVMFKQSSQAKLMENMAEHFEVVKTQNHLAVGDFPSVAAFRNILQSFELANFPKITDKMIKTVDDALMVEIPRLVKQFSNPY